MALKLDDLLTKKKEPVQILDLSRNTANSMEELKKLLEKVPDVKIKMEKVKQNTVNIYDKKFNFKITKRELEHKTFPFIDPIPSEMKSMRLDDLCSVDIQWKMLTSLRPKTKLDEEYYTKMIYLGKLQLSTQEKEKKTPLTSYIRKSKNRAGVLEIKVVSCRECGEEFCSKETCSQFSYDAYERVTTTAAELTAENSIGKEQRKKKRKKKKSLKATTSFKRSKKIKTKTEASKSTKRQMEELNKNSGKCTSGKRSSVIMGVIKNSFRTKLSKVQKRTTKNVKISAGYKYNTQKSILKQKKMKLISKTASIKKTVKDKTNVHSRSTELSLKS